MSRLAAARWFYPFWALAAFWVWAAHIATGFLNGLIAARSGRRSAIVGWLDGVTQQLLVGPLGRPLAVALLIVAGAAAAFGLYRYRGQPRAPSQMLLSMIEDAPARPPPGAAREYDETSEHSVAPAPEAGRAAAAAKPTVSQPVHAEPKRRPRSSAPVVWASDVMVSLTATKPFENALVFEPRDPKLDNSTRNESTLR